MRQLEFFQVVADGLLIALSLNDTNHTYSVAAQDMA